MELLPFVSTVVMLFFTVYVLKRYAVRHAPHFLFWGIGLAMFGVGSFAEAYLSLAWNRWVFFIWYLFGAVLNAAWIGHGTLYLLFRKKWVHGVTGLLVIASLFAGYLMLRAMPTLDEGIYTTTRPVSVQYGSRALAAGEAAPTGAQTTLVTRQGQPVTVVRGLLPLGAPVRLTTPFFNIYGLLTLVGGAIYSAYLFWRKRVLPNRVVGNVLIAAGALSIGFASTLTRLGNGEFLYLGELLAAVLMFLGFLTAGRPQPQENSAPQPATNSAD
jgi:hypothetical protein